MPQGNEKAEPGKVDRFSGLQPGTFSRLCDIAKKAMVELVVQFSCVWILPLLAWLRGITTSRLDNPVRDVAATVLGHASRV